MLVADELVVATSQLQVTALPYVLGFWLALLLLWPTL